MTKQTRQEISAGGIIVSKSPSGWWILLMKDRGGNWTFPKGKIEAGEDHEVTAVREIEEEVGVKGLKYRAKLTPSMYWYFRSGAIKKTVQYLLFEVTKRTKPVVQAEEGITEAKWVRFDRAMKLIGYPKTNTALLDEASGLLGISH